MLALEKLLGIIIKKYLIKTYCLSIFSELALDVVEDVPIMRFNDSDPSSLSTYILHSFDIGCSDFVVMMDSPTDFLSIYDENIHETNQRRATRKIIFLPTSDDEEMRKELISITREPALSFLPDVLLVIPACDLSLNETNCTKYDLGTHRFIGESGNNDLVILDSWNGDDNTFQKNENLFPDKISNLHGRKLNVATFSYKPYSILELDENDNIIGLDGTEMKFCIEFCKWSNCVMEIIRDDEHEWGEIYDNRTGNGILGNIVMDKADIGYGALYSWYHEFLFLDLSMPAVRTGITCIAPVPKLLPRWLLPILPFNSVMWLSVLVSIIIGSFGFFVTSKAGKSQFTIFESVMATIGILVGQVPPIAFPSTYLSQVLSWLLVLSLVLSNVYSSGLASSVTVPLYEDPIDTVQQLVDSGLDWGATHDAWIFSILLSTDPTILELISNFKKLPEATLESRGKTGDFAYSIERLPAGHFAIGEYVTEENVPYLQLMSQDIYWEQCVIMARKSSPYTRQINKFLGRLHQSGLLQSWETQVVLKHSNFVVQLAVKLSLHNTGDGADPEPLVILQLEGPIFLLGFGIFAATIAFIMELCVDYYVKKKNPVIAD